MWLTVMRSRKLNPYPEMEAEIHVLRIGDVAICTNQFELFTDYGIRIQARSNALQTFVVQLAAEQDHTCLPKRLLRAEVTALLSKVAL